MHSECLSSEIRTLSCTTHRYAQKWEHFTPAYNSQQVRLFLNGTIKIVQTTPWPHYPNQNVFSDRRNLLYDKFASFRCDGRLFHSPGPAAANALLLAHVWGLHSSLCNNCYISLQQVAALTIVTRNDWNLSSELSQKRIHHNVHSPQRFIGDRLESGCFPKQNISSLCGKPLVPLPNCICGWSVDVRVSQGANNSHVPGVWLAFFPSYYYYTLCLKKRPNFETV